MQYWKILKALIDLVSLAAYSSSSADTFVKLKIYLKFLECARGWATILLMLGGCREDEIWWSSGISSVSSEMAV